MAEGKALSVFSQSVTARGYQHALPTGPRQSREDHRACLKNAFQMAYSCGPTFEACVGPPLPLPISFPPKLFSPHIGRDGLYTPDLPRRHAEPARVPHLTAIQVISRPWTLYPTARTPNLAAVCPALQALSPNSPNSTQATTGLCPWMERMHHAVWKGINYAPAEKQIYLQVTEISPLPPAPVNPLPLGLEPFVGKQICLQVTLLPNPDPRITNPETLDNKLRRRSTRRLPARP